MRNTYVLMIIQALLLMLLFFSVGYVQYTTIGLFLLIDLILFLNLFTKRWSFEELLTFAAVFTSGLFLIFFTVMRTNTTLVLGTVIMLLFLVIAILELSNAPVSRRRLVRPQVPEFKYSIEYEPYHELDNKRPEPVMHVKKTKSDVRNKLAAKAVAYELEREAQQVKNAQKLIDKMEVYTEAKELENEAKELIKVQRQINQINKIKAKKVAPKKVVKKPVVKKVVAKAAPAKIVETKIVKTVTTTAPKSTRKPKRKKARRTTHRSSLGMKLYAVRDKNGRFKDIQRYSRAHAMDIKRKSKAEIEAKAKKDAQLKFLNKQEEIIEQGKALVNAQKAMNALNAKQSAQKTKTVTKIVKSNEESFYFATENGNKFHEPGCMSIKDVPKNKLTLYTAKKDAMKKGLQPCGTCIPK